jgi:hypothetical protein
MADEDQDKDAPEPEPRLFSLREAERTLRELEPLLVEAMDCRKRYSVIDELFTALSARIMMMGGIVVPYDKLAEQRIEHKNLVETIKAAIERIHSTGCLIKDLEAGLLDFPAIINNEEVYLCWKLGEDRIRFYHRQDEGFSGRKPLDPNDAGPGNPVQ